MLITIIPKLRVGRSQTFSTRSSVPSANLHCITLYLNKEVPSKMVCDHWSSSIQRRGQEITGRKARPAIRKSVKYKTKRKKRNRKPKRSREETTCSTKNHGRLARRGKSRRKRATGNWKRGSSERMQRFIPRDGLLPAKKYRQDDGRQARNRVKREIFEKVPGGEAITWCSPRQNPCSQM